MNQQPELFFFFHRFLIGTVLTLARMALSERDAPD